MTTRLHRALYATALAVFIASATSTLAAARAMSGGTPMPGGWNVGIMWMRMPGQSWMGATTMFVTCGPR